MPGCPRCGKILSSQQALEYHLRRVKRCNSAFKCDDCNKMFRSKEEYLIHKHSCYMPPEKLSRIVQNKHYDIVYILDQSLNIIHCADTTIRGKSFPLLFHHFMRDKLREQIRTGMEKELFKKCGLGYESATWLCSFPCGDKFVVLEKKFQAKHKLPGFLTP